MKNRICLMAVVGAVIESFLPLYAENKPGLQTPYVWMHTSSVNDNLDNKYVWKDLNGNNVKLNVNGQECVNDRSVIRTYNFYPSLSFTDDANSLLRIEGTGLQRATVIGVYGYTSEDDHAEDGFVLNLSSGNENDETVITKANVLHTSSSSRKSFAYNNRNLKATSKSNNEEKQKSLRIMSYTKSANPRPTVSSTFNNISVGGRYVDGETSKEGLFDAESFPEAEKAKRNMSVPELLVYDRALTNDARLKAETYLALKYGITLDVDYTLDEEYGDKGVVWKKDNTYVRVCGYGRMDSYNFNQPWVTTSERETQEYLDDTYYKHSFYNRSAYENLLVAGRYGTLEDKTLIMFADNKRTVELNEEEEGKLTATPENAVNFEQTEETQEYIPLKRIWKLKNFCNEYTDGEHINIVLSEDEGVVEKKFAGSYNIKLVENADVTINNMPAFVNKGEISWVAGALNGDVTVSMGSYNFKFASNGKISVNGDNKANYKRNDLIEVVKKGNSLYVRKNGEIIKSTRVEQNLASTDWNVQISSNGKEFELNEFHVMSDSENNDYMELCYDYAKSMNLYSNGNIYLLMSDKEDFHDENANLRIYKMTSKDRIRSKVMFENLEWKIGDDFTYFTFAISGEPEEDVADKVYDIEVTDPICQGSNNSATGKIKVNFPDDETYAYTLIGPSGTAIKSSEDQLIRGSFEIPYLWIGEYKLYITPYDGVYRFNIIGNSANNEKISFKPHFNNKEQLSATWTVGDAQTYSLAGFTKDFNNINIFCGVKIENGKIYKVENGAVSGEGTPINNGDEVKVVGKGQLQASVYVQNEFAFDIAHNENGNIYWAIETSDGKTVKNLSLDQISINGWAPVVENVHALNLVDSEHLSFQEVGLFEFPFELKCDSEDDNDGENVGDGNIDNLIVQSSTDESNKVYVTLTLPSDYNWKNVYVVNMDGSRYPINLDFIKRENGTDVFQKQLSISSDGTYIIYVESGAGTFEKQFVVR
ncbi:MAG: hypothetical protein K6E14_01260 [Paludibacteraceae bacterium]|nr:hypothetical protein [Paludibacteraceae bacterium]